MIALLLAAALELSPGTTYDPAIPTLRAVAGYASGEEITAPETVTRYLEALAAAAPDRTRLVRYAETAEGRPLFVLVIGSAERLRKLDALKADVQRLADPRALLPADADRLVRELPVVIWLLHAIHGDEVSSTDAALGLAHHLLAAQNDPAADAARREAIVLVDPLQNPDGRARFLASYRLARGPQPDPEPSAAEHDTPWPGGRYNHALFDLNRDWLGQTQPETQGRAKLFLEWRPEVVADLHEMNGESTYFFAPPAEPVNPHVTPKQRAWLDTFGKQNAARFDARGFPYFVRETYDNFYPGYTDSWPALHGAVSMTFEQASPGGLALRREDGTTLTYGDAVLHHFTAALTTVETAAKNREALLRDLVEYRRTAIEGGRDDRDLEYVLLPGKDTARLRRLGHLLQGHGITVRETLEAMRLGNEAIPAGSLVVPRAQAAARLVQTLLDPTIPLEERFVREQDKRRRRRLPSDFFDVTAWSLPLLFDVPVHTTPRPLGVKTQPLAEATAPRVLPGGPMVGYLVPWGTGAATVAIEALRDGLKLRVLRESATLGGGRSVGTGTLLLRSAENAADAPARLLALAARHGVEVLPLSSTWVDEGASLGGRDVRLLRLPRVLLAWDEPTDPTSAGWTRFTLERRYGLPVTAVRTARLGDVELSRYDVLVLPSAKYAFGADLVTRVKDWVKRGGTLVTLAEASRWATRRKVGLLAAKSELRGGKPEKDPDADEEGGKGEKPREDDAESSEPFVLEHALQPEKEAPEATPGALLRVDIDDGHWLGAGTDGEIQAIVDGDRVFTPLRLDKGVNVGTYAPAETLVAGGLAWPEAREQLAQKAFLIEQPLGQGHVVAFAEEPCFRGLAAATELLLMDAVLFGPVF